MTSNPGASQPVWSKRVDPSSLSELNIRYCAGYDVRPREAADRRLLFCDLDTNAAHLLMLARQKIVSSEHGGMIAGALQKLRVRALAGEDLLRPACEDIHMSLEAAITEMIGAEAGGRLHTARSRNDQVATDMRLWLREDAARRVEGLALLAQALDALARRHAATPCPGFTHMQPAMVTSLGHWLMSYIPRVLRVMRQLAAFLSEVDECPLGAAASFGTGWPIDRPLTAELLGFAQPTTSGADGVWSRGEHEARYAAILAQLMASLSGMGQDLILLSTPPRQWLRLAERHTTGSSIMPQKRNPDFAEVTRARAANAAGIANGLLTLTIALPSGYNRDTQWTKYQVFDAADNADDAAELFADVFAGLEVDAGAMRRACGEAFLSATDVADFLSSSRNLPFRAAYRILGAAVKRDEAEGRLREATMNELLAEAGEVPLAPDEWKMLDDAAKLLQRRDQPGNPAPGRTIEALDQLADEVGETGDLVRGRAEDWRDAVGRLWKEIAEFAGQPKP